MKKTVVFESDGALLYGIPPESVIWDELSGAHKHYTRLWNFSNLLWRGRIQVVKTTPIQKADTSTSSPTHERYEEKCYIRLVDLSDDSLVGSASYGRDGRSARLVSAESCCIYF